MMGLDPSIEIRPITTIEKKMTRTTMSSMTTHLQTVSDIVISLNISTKTHCHTTKMNIQMKRIILNSFRITRMTT